MMTGLVPVCLDNHDVELFIDRGVNGFYADEPDELADFINYLFRNREAARSIGIAARRTALDIFNHDRMRGRKVERPDLVPCGELNDAVLMQPHTFPDEPFSKSVHPRLVNDGF